MSRFIKLTKKIINIKHISYIEKIEKTKYIENAFNIYIAVPKINGFHFFSFGMITPQEYVISVNEGINKQDYETIKRFVEGISTPPSETLFVDDGCNCVSQSHPPDNR